MLSQREEQVLRFVREYRDHREIMPSIREIGAACGLSSTNTVEYALKGLARKGYVERYANVARGVRLTSLGRAATAADEAEVGQP